jgi:O-antigen ligase
MNREVLDRWCQRGIQGLVLAILVFGPLATGAVRSLEFLILQGLALGVMLLWSLRLALNSHIQFLWPPVCWVVLAFAGYAVGRYLTCDIEYVGRQELIRLLVYAFLFLAILNNLYGQEETRIISFTLIFLAMAISGYAIYQFLTKSQYVWHFFTDHTPGRASGTYISPNHLAGFLELLLPLALAYTLVGRSKPVTKVFLGYAALVMGAGLAVTVSRGGWLAAGFALLSLFGILATHRNYRLPAVVLMTLLLVACVFTFTRTQFFKERMKAGLEDTKNLEVSTRFELWRSAAQMWRDHLWFGVGPGHYDYRFGAYRPEAVQLRPDRAHNEYLNALADWGVAGTTMVVAALAVLFLGLSRSWRFVRRPETEFRSNLSNKFAFVLGATMGLVALLAHSVVDFNLHIPANAILAISLMALLSSHLRFATDRYWITARRGGRALGAGVLAAGMGYLGYQEVRLGREYVWLQEATEAEPYSPEQLASLERAHSIEPRNFGTAYSLGETNRNLGFDTGDVTLVSQAMEWYELGIKANPFNGYNYLRYGMCLDFLERFEEAEPYISKADELEPNNYYVAANIGWHYVQAGQYAAARPWLERSLRLQWKENAIAVSYLAIANERLLQAASNPGFPTTPADPIPLYRATDDASESTGADPREGENNN